MMNQMMNSMRMIATLATPNNVNNEQSGAA